MKSYTDSYHGYPIETTYSRDSQNFDHCLTLSCTVNGQGYIHMESSRFKWLLMLKAWRAVKKTAAFIDEHENYGWVSPDKFLPEDDKPVPVQTQFDSSLLVATMSYTEHGWKLGTLLGTWHGQLVVRKWWRKKP